VWVFVSLYKQQALLSLGCGKFMAGSGRAVVCIRRTYFQFVYETLRANNFDVIAKRFPFKGA
jgi:hypothetical protein